MRFFLVRNSARRDFWEEFSCGDEGLETRLVILLIEGCREQQYPASPGRIRCDRAGYHGAHSRETTACREGNDAVQEARYFMC